MLGSCYDACTLAGRATVIWLPIIVFKKQFITWYIAVLQMMLYLQLYFPLGSQEEDTA